MRFEIDRDQRVAVLLTREDLLCATGQRVARKHPPLAPDTKRLARRGFAAVEIAHEQVTLGAVAAELIQKLALSQSFRVRAVNRPPGSKAFDEFAFVPVAAVGAFREQHRAT